MIIYPLFVSSIFVEENGWERKKSSFQKNWKEKFSLLVPFFSIKIKFTNTRSKMKKLLEAFSSFKSTSFQRFELWTEFATTSTSTLNNLLKTNNYINIHNGMILCERSANDDLNTISRFPKSAKSPNQCYLYCGSIRYIKRNYKRIKKNTFCYKAVGRV